MMNNSFHSIRKFVFDKKISFCFIFFIASSFVFIDNAMAPYQKKLLLIICSVAVISSIIFSLGDGFGNKFKHSLSCAMLLMIPGLFSILYNGKIVYYHIISVGLYSFFIAMLGIYVARSNLNVRNDVKLFLKLLAAYLIFEFYDFISELVNFMLDIYYGSSNVLEVPVYGKLIERPVLGFLLLFGLICVLRLEKEMHSHFVVLYAFFISALLGIAANRSAIVAAVIYLFIVMMAGRGRRRLVLMCLLAMVLSISIYGDHSLRFIQEHVKDIKYSRPGSGEFNFQTLLGAKTVNSSVESAKSAKSAKSTKVSGEASVKISDPRLFLWGQYLNEADHSYVFGRGTIGASLNKIPAGFSENPYMFSNTLMHNFIIQSFLDFGIAPVALFLMALYFLVLKDRVGFVLPLRLIPFFVFFSFQNGLSLYMLSYQFFLVFFLVFSNVRDVADVV